MTTRAWDLGFDLPRRTVALVLAGGRGRRLHELTARRAKPELPFGGQFRIVDFALSNCLNSGIRRMVVVTQYEGMDLLRHLQRGWGFLRPELNEFVDYLPARQRRDEQGWYLGTADAVRQNLDVLAEHRADYILVLAGDHVYKMNYAVMLADHVHTGAECTVGCVEVTQHEARAYGVMAVDDRRRIVDFVEKPADPRCIPGKPDRTLASMGIYVFNARFLYTELTRDSLDPTSSHDFGKDIIARLAANGQAAAHPFELSCVGMPVGGDAYWRDVGTIDSLWDANIDLTATEPLLNLWDPKWPVWTYQPPLPPAKFVHNLDDRRGAAIESLVSGGSIISGSVFRSLVSPRVQVGSFAQVNWSVLMPGVQVGRGARLTRTVIDEGCSLPEGIVIGEDPADDARRFRRTESGVTLVTRDMLWALG